MIENLNVFHDRKSEQENGNGGRVHGDELLKMISGKVAGSRGKETENGWLYLYLNIFLAAC